MSRHYFYTSHNEEPIEVLMGYDRPLNGYFMSLQKNVCDVSEIHTKDLYSNMFSFPKSLDGYMNVLEHMGIRVPIQMFEEVLEDFIGQAGNKVVVHALDENGKYTRVQTE